MNANKKPIGIFDSGLGGLTVLKELKKLLPHETFIYFGDTAHLPYGNKSNETIIQYSLKISKFLISQNIKSIIIACNTASSVAFKVLQKQLQIPIFNVIDPCVVEALKLTKTNKIAVIGTETTISSQAYQKKIRHLNKRTTIIAQPCPLFVPLVEEGLVNQPFAQKITKFYFNKIIASTIDTLILGCTHYPLMIKTIKKTIQKDIKIIDSSKITAKHIKQHYTNKSTQTTQMQPNKDKFYVTDKPQKFNQLAKKFLETKNIKAKQITL